MFLRKIERVNRPLTFEKNGKKKVYEIDIQ